MTRPEAHRIDQKSKRTFEGLLPDSWPARSQGQEKGTQPIVFGTGRAGE